MYFPYFAVYMAAGLIISILVFLWAMKTGQFREQQRARYLPLEPGAEREPVKLTRFQRIQAFLLFALVFLGLMTSMTFVVFVLVKSRAAGG